VPRWERLLRGGTDSRRNDSPTLFYPIYINPIKKKITGVGDIMPLGQNPDLNSYPEMTVAWPIRTDGSFGRWQVSPPTFKELIDLGFARLGTYDKKRKTWTVLYLNRGTRKRIDGGEIIITGKDPITGVVSVEFATSEARLRNIKTVWYRRLHDSGVYGSSLLKTVIGRETNFAFPKSLYSTKDAVATVVRNNQNALIVDFFAGSGTTLHAVNLLNAEDGGSRQCILVTNNEVSEQEAKTLRQEGHAPGDAEWEKHGICRSVTWPRTEYSILGRRGDGSFLEGEYYTNQTAEREESRQFFQLSFIEDSAALSVPEKKQILSLLRSKEGKNLLPQTLVKPDSAFIVSDKHTASIIFDCSASSEWLEALEEQDLLRLTLRRKNNRIIRPGNCNGEYKAPHERRLSRQRGILQTWLSRPGKCFPWPPVSGNPASPVA
jgi:adenine-specific DNA-methyltransferase